MIALLSRPGFAVVEEAPALGFTPPELLVDDDAATGTHRYVRPRCPAVGAEDDRRFGYRRMSIASAGQ